MGLDISHCVPIISQPEDNSLNYIEIKDLNPEYLEKNKTFIAEKDFEEFGKSEVIFFLTRGYQRKGMSRKFYSDFQNDGIYYDLQSVKQAYHYLEGDHISSKQELQINFQKNFIDNFVEGKSIFFISW